jgi:hypothetical protein
LLKYITVMPKADEGHDRGHKFPFLANQVFLEGGKGVDCIVEQFFYKVIPDSELSNPFKTNKVDVIVENENNSSINSNEF